MHPFPFTPLLKTQVLHTSNRSDRSLGPSSPAVVVRGWAGSASLQTQPRKHVVYRTMQTIRLTAGNTTSHTRRSYQVGNRSSAWKGLLLILLVDHEVGRTDDL